MRAQRGKLGAASFARVSTPRSTRQGYSKGLPGVKLAAT
jgi:hypothetical protein